MKRSSIEVEQGLAVLSTFTGSAEPNPVKIRKTFAKEVVEALSKPKYVRVTNSHGVVNPPLEVKPVPNFMDGRPPTSVRLPDERNF